MQYKNVGFATVHQIDVGSMHGGVDVRLDLTILHKIGDPTPFLTIRDIELTGMDLDNSYLLTKTALKDGVPCTITLELDYDPDSSGE